MTKKKIHSEAARIIKLLDLPVHHVSVLGKIGGEGYPRECPIHGLPPAVNMGQTCSICYAIHNEAKQQAVEFLRELARESQP